MKAAWLSIKTWIIETIFIESAGAVVERIERVLVFFLRLSTAGRIIVSTLLLIIGTGLITSGIIWSKTKTYRSASFYENSRKLAENSDYSEAYAEAYLAYQQEPSNIEILDWVASLADTMNMQTTVAWREAIAAKSGYQIDKVVEAGRAAIKYKDPFVAEKYLNYAIASGVRSADVAALQVDWLLLANKTDMALKAAQAALSLADFQPENLSPEFLRFALSLGDENLKDLARTQLKELLKGGGKDAKMARELLMMSPTTSTEARLTFLRETLSHYPEDPKYILVLLDRLLSSQVISWDEALSFIENDIAEEEGLLGYVADWLYASDKSAEVVALLKDRNPMDSRLKCRAMLLSMCDTGRSNLVIELIADSERDVLPLRSAELRFIQGLANYRITFEVQAFLDNLVPALEFATVEVLSLFDREVKRLRLEPVAILVLKAQLDIPQLRGEALSRLVGYYYLSGNEDALRKLTVDHSFEEFTVNESELLGYSRFIYALYSEETERLMHAFEDALIVDPGREQLISSLILLYWRRSEFAAAERLARDMLPNLRSLSAEELLPIALVLNERDGFLFPEGFWESLAGRLPLPEAKRLASPERQTQLTN